MSEEDKKEMSTEDMMSQVEALMNLFLKENLEETWKKEKSQVQGAHHLKEELEQVKTEFETASRNNDWTRARVLQYGNIPALEAKFAHSYEQVAYMVIKMEKDKASKERLKELASVIKKLEKKYADLEETWKKEKSQVQGAQHLKEELEQVKTELETASRNNDFAKMSELQYGNIPALEAKIWQAGSPDNKEIHQQCTNDNIKQIVEEQIGRLGFEADLNHLDVSGVTYMYGIFQRSQFKGDISKWDVSNVTNMNSMFKFSQFNGDISNWDVSGVTYMWDMFCDSQFNGDISKWDVSKVTDMRGMFLTSKFNGDISNWDVSNVEDMEHLFMLSQFNGDIGNWDVSNLPSTRRMFEKSKFNGDISNWDVSNVTDMSSMFDRSQFNGDISKWDVSNVTDMSNMFSGSKFNDDISKWDVSEVTNMGSMFCCSQFNGDISKWDVSRVKRMSAMFDRSQFNGDISKWDVSNVVEMTNMFKNSKFNGNISKWDMSKVTWMDNMFDNCPIKIWHKPNKIIAQYFSRSVKPKKPKKTIAQYYSRLVNEKKNVIKGIKEKPKLVKPILLVLFVVIYVANLVWWFLSPFGIIIMGFIFWYVFAKDGMEELKDAKLFARFVVLTSKFRK